MKPVTSYTEDVLKICSDCKIAKSKDCYYSNSHKWDGIANVCKTCNCKRDKLKDNVNNAVVITSTAASGSMPAIPGLIVTVNQVG